MADSAAPGEKAPPLLKRGEAGSFREETAAFEREIAGHFEHMDREERRRLVERSNRLMRDLGMTFHRYPSDGSPDAVPFDPLPRLVGGGSGRI